MTVRNLEAALARARRLPRIRYMGSKYRLLDWLQQVFSSLEFETALDAFSGSSCVGYLLKSMGKRVDCNDFLEFPRQIARAVVENSHLRLEEAHLARLLEPNPRRENFIERTFRGIFYTPRDLRFLDNLWSNLDTLGEAPLRALALAAVVRACVKRQPRGVFTVAGDPERYKDGRRDLRLDLRSLFLESVEAYHGCIFDNGQRNRALRSDVLELSAEGYDLVYLDPPYVPRSDDNCYVKRYHFLEGLMSYWRDPDARILPDSRVRKIAKRKTPFSYRSEALTAFDRIFERFRDSILVLSYSSNGFPGIEQLRDHMARVKPQVEVFQRPHRYTFGTHRTVRPERARVREFLLVGHAGECRA